MKRLLLNLSLAVVSLSFLAATMPVDAKRLGGGSSSGMKRQTPPPNQAPQATPNTPAAPTGTAAATGAAGATGAAAAAGKRSWMGPLAGLAAGLGIAALMSHLGMGAAMGNFLTIALLAVAAFFLIRFLMRRFGPNANQRSAAPMGMQYAGAGAAPGAGSGSVFPNNSSAFQRQDPPAFAAATGSGPAGAAPFAASLASATPGYLPPGFDVPAFERIAKLIFIRMQASNDAGDLNDLRQFSTPEMFATFKLDLQDRPAGAQQTDVVQLNAQVLDFADEAERQIVSVRFHGLIREEAHQPTTTFDEVWHLVKPRDGSREWAIAGITQSEVA